MSASARDQFIGLLDGAIQDGSLVKLTLAKPVGPDPTLKHLFVRPVILKAGPRLAFVWSHETHQVTKNHEIRDALPLIEPLIGSDFLDAHLFTATTHAQLECDQAGGARLRKTAAALPQEPATAHDRQKNHPVPADARWLRALGVTNDLGRPRAGMSDKFRQIQRFSELLIHLIDEASLPTGRPLTAVDMGSGKGYLTFAVSFLLGEKAQVLGIEARAELVELCNRISKEEGLAGRLSFVHGTIADDAPPSMDLLIALHACDTATDDALAKGISAGAALLVVAPCCQKELRSQLKAPPGFEEAFKHGIFQERQAEFVTDALRAQLLEWAGYRTKVFEFISTEHTAKNLMIAAVKAGPAGDPSFEKGIWAFASLYGVRSHALARHLGFPLP